jgi:hypothetical protein
MYRTGLLNIESAGVREEPPGFWRRQFRPEATRRQTVFDVLLGVVLPVLCFIFDPLVFRGNFIGGMPLFGSLQFLAYAIAFIEISTLTIWLCARERVGAYTVAIGGFLYAGALVSFLIGVILLPFSAIGIFFAGIGLLGLIPFLTAIVFWRNGRRAVNLHPCGATPRRKLAAFIMGMIFAAGFPLAAHLKISRVTRASLQTIQQGDAGEVEDATEQLRLINYLTGANTDELVWAYQSEQDQTRRERLARAYRRITGQDIETRRTSLLD